MLYFLPTPIGNLSDISTHSLDILYISEFILCEDIRVTKKLINLLQTKLNTNFGAKEYISVHSHNEKQILSEISDILQSRICVYMSDAGMPCISDPGVYLVRYAQSLDIPYEVISGTNAVILAAAASGLVEKEFIFLGFFPNTGKERSQAIENALNLAYPAVVYESPKRILSLIESITKLAPRRKVFLIKEATKKFETKFWGEASEVFKNLKEANLNGEWSVVIGASSMA
ncbi:MAG: 16S rRNA (cytidine(1402)-2'-O)-methyltransferase, partial [Campylobacter sp.]|nr:16S rRNA (cytidine(1402)-2'-O)-methyltransferase [Campylobacter sp.]